MNRRVVLLSHSEHGHRRAYIDQFSRLLRGLGVEVAVRTHWRQTLDEQDSVLFLMIEESLLGYVATGLWRAFRGRRTAGLLFRGGECVRSARLRLRVKRLLLRALKRVRNVQTLTITTFEVEPALVAVADGWIHDPQLWDLSENHAVAPTPLSQQVRAAAGDRHILIALGLQNASKGFDVFCRLWLDDPNVHQHWLFVSAGKTSPEEQETAEAFGAAGGLVIDRFVSDDELLGLYGEASVIWACYAPNYDQSSGIFGRAYQFGKPVVVRAGSQMDALATALGQLAIRLDWSRPSPALTLLSMPTEAHARVPVEVIRRSSLDALGRALGVSLT